MAIVKIIDNPLDTCEALRNLCNYLTRRDDRDYRVYIGTRGLSICNAYEEILEAQTLFGKTTGRKGYHLVISFNEGEPFCEYDFIQMTPRIIERLFPTCQVLFSIHMKPKHPHIHMFVGSVFLNNGHKLHIGFRELKYFNEQINRISETYY